MELTLREVHLWQAAEAIFSRLTLSPIRINFPLKLNIPYIVISAHHFIKYFSYWILQNINFVTCYRNVMKVWDNNRFSPQILILKEVIFYTSFDVNVYPLSCTHIPQDYQCKLVQCATEFISLSLPLKFSINLILLHYIQCMNSVLLFCLYV